MQMQANEIAAIRGYNFLLFSCQRQSVTSSFEVDFCKGKGSLESKQLFMRLKVRDALDVRAYNCIDIMF